MSNPLDKESPLIPDDAEPGTDWWSTGQPYDTEVTAGFPAPTGIDALRVVHFPGGPFTLSGRAGHQVVSYPPEMQSGNGPGARELGGGYS